MCENSSLIGEISSPAGAYARAHGLAKEVVALGAVKYGTKEYAIQTISRQHMLGSFLKKVFYGQPATIHLHLFHRLCDALENLNDLQEKRIERNRYILNRVRNRDAGPERIVAIHQKFNNRNAAAT